MCQPTKSGGLIPILCLVAVGVAAVIVARIVAVVWPVLVVIWEILMIALTVAQFALPAAVAGLAGYRVVRFARAPRETKKNYGLAIRARIRWKYTMRSLRLVLADSRHPTVIDRPVYGPRLVHGEHVRKPRPRTRAPGVRIRATRHGIEAKVRTVPSIGREEFEEAARYLADYWKCQRVAVTQPKPGRLIVRGLRRDPLLEHLALEHAPVSEGEPWKIWLGRDEHGADRFLDLRNVSGITVGGQPGGGKSQAITSWETQLAPSDAVQFVNCDGKGAGEFDDFTDRAWITAGDSMDSLLATLKTLTDLMYDRLRTVRTFTGGKKNIWTVGVSADWPLIFSAFDETQTWLDLPAAKAMGKDKEKDAAEAIKLASELVRKGRSVGFVSVFGTQKPTSDSLPSAISANCALRAAFSLATLDGAKATLGQSIADYPSVSPVTLSLPEHAGVAVVTLKDGLSPFTMLRSPMVTEDQAARVATETAHLHRDPAALLPVTVPDDVSELLDA